MHTSSNPTADLMKSLTPSPRNMRRCWRKETPSSEPGMLPTAIASTTLRRTVRFHRCRAPAGILVRKLKSASDPTAMMAGTCRPKMSVGSSSTPPPSPVNPISVPTAKPIRIFASKSSMPYLVVPDPQFCVKQKRPERRELRTGNWGLSLSVVVNSNEALAFQMQNDGLRGLIGTQLPGVNHNLGVRGRFIRIGNTRELLYDAGACLGV